MRSNLNISTPVAKLDHEDFTKTETDIEMTEPSNAFLHGVFTLENLEENLNPMKEKMDSIHCKTDPRVK